MCIRDRTVNASTLLTIGARFSSKRFRIDKNSTSLLIDAKLGSSPGEKTNPIAAVLLSHIRASLVCPFSEYAVARLYISLGWLGRNSAARLIFERNNG